MRTKSRALFSSLILMSIVVAQGVAFEPIFPPQSLPAQSLNVVGRWRVTFALSGGAEKNLILDADVKGSGSFRLLDTGPDNTPLADPLPAVWSQLTNNRISFSGEAELPLGTCCREMGTLIFKGKFLSNNSMSGKLIFVTSIDEEESPYRFRSMVGTFAATRVTGKQ
jgi:hypothetical protein